MRREHRVWPKTKALMGAMREGARMRGEGVSAEDVAKGLEAFLRDLIPPQTPREFLCGQCGGTGYRTVRFHSELYGEEVDGTGLCLCSKGQGIRAARQAAQDDSSERNVRRKAANW